MSFSVRLTADLVTVEAGATVPVSIEVASKGSEPDRFEIQVEGIDPEWVAIPEPVFVVDPGEVHVEKLFLKVPRSSESQAGNYPFVVRVRSLNSGEAKTAPGVGQVKQFHYLTMEIGPKKGMYSPTRKQNGFAVTILNLGNTDHTLQLFGNDPDEECGYEFETEQVVVAPGQQKVVELAVTPSSTSFLSSSRLHGFSVSARSVEHPNVMASAQAQLEQRPFLTPATLTFLVLLLVVIGAWFALLPKPPQVSLAISKSNALVGETINVRWTTQHADSVMLTVDGVPIVAEPPLNGETDFKLEKAGTIIFSAIARRAQRETQPELETVVVTVPEPSPKPVVTLRSQRRTINLGESVELLYTAENAVEAYLQPGPQKLVLTLKSITVQPNKEGPNEYEIVATGKDGQVSTAKVTVNVVDRSRVVVLAFSAKPGKLDVGGGYVTLSWQVSNAARVEIVGGPSDPIVPENPNAAGSEEFMIDKTTTFTIKAIDSNGKSISKSVKVEVAEPSAPPVGPLDPGIPPTSTPPGTTTGGGR